VITSANAAAAREMSGRNDNVVELSGRASELDAIVSLVTRPEGIQPPYETGQRGR
jgi:hypothetical protein